MPILFLKPKNRNPHQSPMKKTSTLKNAEPKAKSRAKSGSDHKSSEPGAFYEPDAQAISNILNYSKALSVKKSKLMNHILLMNN